MNINNNMKLREIEKVVILDRLEKNNGNRTHTAKDLGIGLRTLQRKLDRYGIPKGDSGAKSVRSTKIQDDEPTVTDVECDGATLRATIHVKPRVKTIKNISFSK